MQVLLRGDADQIAEMIAAGSVDDEMSEVGEMLQKLGRHSDLYAEVKRCVVLKRIFARLRLGAAPEEAVGDALPAAELEGLLSRLWEEVQWHSKWLSFLALGTIRHFKPLTPELNRCVLCTEIG